ncbi:hypothetical protein P2H44_25285 [Albimonas sp. CAU 1670]|uniref:hypothetical protein n=1 Tax=Albimonas sp. CAU 1670 TaxID=3032599 RepID=UPI0023DC5588|nr:hypothetical protein [Albimonas sp. CAU 1670]MDF2235880.1 hypothetical protein [Albimonas sp. CAU 1670]
MTAYRSAAPVRAALFASLLVIAALGAAQAGCPYKLSSLPELLEELETGVAAAEKRLDGVDGRLRKIRHDAIMDCVGTDAGTRAAQLVAGLADIDHAGMRNRADELDSCLAEKADIARSRYEQAGRSGETALQQRYLRLIGQIGELETEAAAAGMSAAALHDKLQRIGIEAELLEELCMKLDF